MKDMLAEIAHRPFPMPESNSWIYYQEWNRVVFLHWEVPYQSLRKLVPDSLEIDTYQNQCFVSLVAFTMEKIRPRFLPSFPPISNFAEINVRTYVKHQNKAGVFFLNIEAEKWISTFLAKQLSGLPYEKSQMKLSPNRFLSQNSKKNFHLDIQFEVQEKITQKSDLDLWLTQRYCLYLEDNQQIYIYDIHHKEWEIKKINLKSLNLYYKIGDLELKNPPFLYDYSEGVEVVAWKKEKILF